MALLQKKYQELNPEIQSSWVKREITKCLNKESGEDKIC